MPYPINKEQEKRSGQPAMNGSKQAGYGYKSHCRFTGRIGTLVDSLR
jgi:hypothetical protein